MTRSWTIGLVIYVLICLAIFCYVAFVQKVSTFPLLVLGGIFVVVGALLGVLGARSGRTTTTRR